MGRYLSSFVMLLAVVFWLFFSYTPGAAKALPKFAALGGLPERWSQGFAVMALLAFVLVQLVIFHATTRLKTAAVQDAEHKIHLNFVLELFWTVLPLVMTVALALLSYRTWFSLSAP